MTSAEHAVRLAQAIAAYRAGDDDTAERLYCEVLATDPVNQDALEVLALVYHRRGASDLACGLLEAAHRREPKSQTALNLGVVQMHRGEVDQACVSLRAAIALDPHNPQAWANLLFALDAHPHATPALLRETREAFDRTACRALTEAAAPHARDRAPDRRPRVGYLGADFRAAHSASRSFGFLLHHDPAAVDVYLYSTYAGPSTPTDERFRDRADVWCEVAALSDDDLADVIRADQIDVLVDLGGVSAGGRPLVMAHKPAPIQVGGWGYPHGLGIRAMDAMIGDDIATPPEHEAWYPERIIRLPCLIGHWADETLPEIADRRSPTRTCGYFGRATKLSPRTLAAWAALLRGDRHARLLLKHPQYAVTAMRERVLGALVALGVEQDRIEVRGQTSRWEHLAAHNEVDVCLDPVGIGGGQTVLDACLMGVPTVTLPTETVSGRIGASILTTLDHGDLVADDDHEYLEVALAATRDISRRQAFRERTLASILCDGPAYARAVEAAYRTLWQAWCKEAT